MSDLCVKTQDKESAKAQEERFHDLLKAFVRESNRIEGIHRAPTKKEIEATKAFVLKTTCTIDDVLTLQAVYAPKMPLRVKEGMNVRVGRYFPPPGGPQIRADLIRILEQMDAFTPWETHVQFEKLHPFMDGNGRTGRALWAWHRMTRREHPFVLGFLHSFYYETLASQS